MTKVFNPVISPPLAIYFFDFGTLKQSDLILQIFLHQNITFMVYTINTKKWSNQKLNREFSGHIFKCSQPTELSSLEVQPVYIVFI